MVLWRADRALASGLVCNDWPDTCRVCSRGRCSCNDCRQQYLVAAAIASNTFFIFVFCAVCFFLALAFVFGADWYREGIDRSLLLRVKGPVYCR